MSRNKYDKMNNVGFAEHAAGKAGSKAGLLFCLWLHVRWCCCLMGPKYMTLLQVSSKVFINCCRFSCARQRRNGLRNKTIAVQHPAEKEISISIQLSTLFIITIYIQRNKRFYHKSAMRVCMYLYIELFFKTK